MNCYVLIGGGSSRMGRSKPELFLPAIAAAATPVFERVFAVQRRGGPAASVETIFEREHDEEAPIFGLEAALEHAKAPCFVLATDYARITAELLRFVCDEAERSEATIVAPLWNNIPQTLCAAYRPEILPAVQQRITAGRLDVRGLVATVATKFINEETIRARFGNQALISVNTPEELAEAERLE